MAKKGVISAIEQQVKDANDNPAMARVAVNGYVTAPLVIPTHLRGTAGNLTQNTEVVFEVFEDGTGIILARADGETF